MAASRESPKRSWTSLTLPECSHSSGGQSQRSPRKSISKSLDSIRKGLKIQAHNKARSSGTFSGSALTSAGALRCKTTLGSRSHIWLESKKRLLEYVAQKPADIGLRSQFALRLYSWAKKYVTVGTKRISLEQLRKGARSGIGTRCGRKYHPKSAFAGVGKPAPERWILPLGRLMSRSRCWSDHCIGG